MKIFQLRLVALAGAELYCPDQSSFQGFGGGTTWEGNSGGAGWTIKGSGGVHGLTSFNLLGGYVEFDMDNSGASLGMNNNFYTISPDHPYTSYNDYCDGQGPDASSPLGVYCMEMDIIEANGNCAAATTWHTEFNHDGGCDQGGCAVTEYLGGKIHIRAEFGEDGWMRTFYNGKELTNFDRQPDDGARQKVKDTMSSVGIAVQSTQWNGWVPGESTCGSGDPDPNSVFSISNLRFSGSVIFGPEPPVCGTPPAPTPAPVPTPPAPPSACAADNEDCRASRCCQTTGATCYEKDSGWASCRTDECVPGSINPNDPPEYQTPWDCTPLSFSFV